MSIYQADGTELRTAYNKKGKTISVAYDREETIVFPDALRVMEYNVGGWYIGSGTNVPANADATWYALQDGIISRQDADILCICEYWSQFSKTGRTAQSVLLPYFRYIHEEDGTAKYHGHAICSKYPIRSYTTHIYTDSVSDTNKRYYDEAVINIRGANVHVFVTHLHASDIPKRIQEAGELFDYVQTLTEPFIVCGDFNSPLHDPFSSQNTGVYQQFLDEGCTIANGGSHGILNTACNSANWDNDKFAIDNIICSPGFIINNVWTDEEKTTDSNVLATNKIDHIPIIAEIDME